MQKNQIKLINVDNTASYVNRNNVIKRRNETFAEAEQRMKTKNIEVGILGPGEIAGMCECIFNMPSYMQTIKCTESCDVYFIYKRSYDRLIAKRNPMCIKKMRENVYMKLRARNARLKSVTPVDLFRSIQYRIELMKRKDNVYSSTYHQYQNYNSFNEPQTDSPNENEHLNDVGLGPSNQMGDSSKFRSMPRGPIVQLDSKSRTAAYFRLKNILNARKKRQAESEQKLVALNAINSNNLNESFDKKQSGKDGLVNFIHLESADGVLVSERDGTNKNTPFQEVVNLNGDSARLDDDNTANLALENLEDRIKKWHLDFGCKKVSVTKLNRIDLNVGQLFIQK